MRTVPFLIAASLTLLASAVYAAPVKDATEDFAKRLLAVKSVEQKTYACFMRSYDASHLARHARQKVGMMRLLVAAERLPEDSALSYSFRLGVTLRHRKGDFVSNGDCGHAEVSKLKREGIRISCGGDCGGGGMAIGLAADDKSLFVKLEEIAIWRADKPDDESTQLELRGGADDRVFRLDRVSNEICAPLAREEALAASQPD
jgi:hypothetical protein